MRTNTGIQKMCAAALLCAIGILIPLISPIKITVGPMSFTLASHVALFIAMFLSPGIALAVELGTTLGFLLAGFPLVVVLRAASQVGFVLLGAWVLQKKPGCMRSPAGVFLFGLGLGVVHATGEALVVTAFYLAGMSFSQGFAYTVLGLVGVGTLVHSMVDYGIALLIWRAAAHTVKLPANYLPTRAAEKHI